jgi:hypothetical protein
MIAIKMVFFWILAVQPSWADHEVDCSIIYLKIQPVHEQYFVSYVKEMAGLDPIRKRTLIWLGKELTDFGMRSKYDRSMVFAVLKSALTGRTKQDFLWVSDTWLDPGQASMVTDDLDSFLKIFLDRLEERMPFQKGARWSGNILKLIQKLAILNLLPK